jgi:hypothetical protein
MGKRKRLATDPTISHYYVKFDPEEVREYLKRKKRREEPPSSSVAAPAVFAISELAEAILLHLPHQDLLRFQLVNRTSHQLITKSSHIQQKLFFAPSRIPAPIDWNPFVSCAFPQWFGSGRRPMRPGETRILTHYDMEKGQHAIKESREGEGASWRRMLICSESLTSIHVLHNDRTIWKKENMKSVCMGAIHECIEYVRSHRPYPHFQIIKFAYNAQVFKIELV